MKTKYSEGDVMDYANTGAAISSGDVVALGNRIGIAVTDIAATTGLGAVALTGAHTLAKTVGEVYNQGDSVYWNSTTSKLTEVDTGLYAGKIIVAAALTATTAIVALADPGPGAGFTAGKRRVFHWDAIGICTPILDENDLLTSYGGGGALRYTLTGTNPTCAKLDVHGGGLKCSMTADDETANQCLSLADHLCFSGAQGLIAECRVKMDTIPVAATSKFFFGLASARNDDPEAITEHVSFFMADTGDLMVSWDDGTVDLGDGDTGINWANGEEKTLRIDMTDLDAIKVFVDDVDVTAAVIASATGPPTSIDHGAAGTGLYQIYVQGQKTSTNPEPVFTLKELNVWADT